MGNNSQSACTVAPSLKLSGTLIFWIRWGQIWLRPLSHWEPREIRNIHGFMLTKPNIQHDLPGQDSQRAWDTQSSLWGNAGDSFSDVTHCDLTPNTMQSCQALVTFNCFVALITLGWAVAFNPVMVHDLEQNQSSVVRGDIPQCHPQRVSMAPHLHPCSSWTSRKFWCKREVL